MNKEIIGDAEILSLTTQTGYISSAPWFDLDNMLTEQECRIHSVKRISDDMVFTIGDKVTYTENKDAWIISGLSINKDINQVMANEKPKSKYDTLRDIEWCSINTKNFRKL